VDNTTDTVYEYSSSRSRTSGSQTAVRTFTLTTGNGNPQGIADPPPPTASATGQNDDPPAADRRADGRVASVLTVPVSPVPRSAWPAHLIPSDRPRPAINSQGSEYSQQGAPRGTRLPHPRPARTAILKTAVATAPPAIRETQTSPGLLDQLFADLMLPEQLAGI
jgi:hypothetical protein